jgi:putative endonuclease
MKPPSYVYIITKKRNGTLYIGVTTNLIRRVSEHKLKLADGFSKSYNLNILVWYEEHPDIYSAIRREKQLKKWNRNYKLELIEQTNPSWNDLSLTLD